MPPREDNTQKDESFEEEKMDSMQKDDEQMRAEGYANAKYVASIMREMQCPKEWYTATIVKVKRMPLVATECVKDLFVTLSNIPLTEETKKAGPFGGRCSVEREPESPTVPHRHRLSQELSG